MIGYVVRRLLQFVPVLLGTLFLIHYLTSIGIQLTGNPVHAIFGLRQPPESVVAAVTAQFGLDNACLEQVGNPCLGLFFERLTGYAAGDFGTDFNNQPVAGLLAERWPITARLAILAIMFEMVLGTLAGVAAGLRKDRFADYGIKVFTVLLVAVPVFVLGVLVQVALAVGPAEWVNNQPWLAPWLGPIFSVTYNSAHPWASLVIPALVLGALSLASVARLTRTGLVENMGSDYVRTARAKGLLPRRIVGVHALRNSLIPVVTFVGADFGFLIGGSIVIEGIFNIPGIGNLTYHSALSGEVPVTIAVVTVLVLVFLIVNLVVDLVYALLDPRIRYA